MTTVDRFRVESKGNKAKISKESFSLWILIISYSPEMSIKNLISPWSVAEPLIISDDDFKLFSIRALLVHRQHSENKRSNMIFDCLSNKIYDLIS